MGAVVTLAGTVLANPDGNGISWHPIVDGWESPPVRSEVHTAPGVHGGFAGDWAYAPRALVLHGIADCPSETLMWAGIDLLAQLSDATEQTVELRVANASGVLACQVRAADAMKVAVRGDRAFEYSVPLVALDPAKYSTTTKTLVATVGTAAVNGTATMAGTLKRVSPLTLTLLGGGGGATNFHIRNNTDGIGSLMYFRGIASGETVTIDWRARTALSSVSGFHNAAITTASIWPDLIRGANSIDMWTDGNTVTATLAWQDGYR